MTSEELTRYDPHAQTIELAVLLAKDLRSTVPTTSP